MPAASDPPPVRHHHLYFADGDMVISAPKAPPRWKPEEPAHNMLFRVHKVLLSHYSHVFSDMLSTHNVRLPDEENMYDGVDLVAVPDDAKDFERLLLYVYEPSSFPSSKYDPYFAVDMCGVMALATKYDFSDLRLRIVRHFQQEWPTSAHTWEAWVKQSDAQLILNNKSRYDHPHDVVNLHWPEPASAIHFARAFDIPSVLPAAFYRLSLIQTEIDWDRYDQLDFPYDDRLVARWSLLNAEDLMTVMQLKFRCARLMERMPVSLSKMTCDCGDEGCTGSLQKLWAMISESHTASESDPLQAFSMRWRDDHTAYYGVCHSMYTQYRQQAEIIMEGIWKDLQIIVTRVDYPDTLGIYL